MKTITTIKLKNIALYGYHGVLAEETKLGQRFYYDIIAIVDETIVNQAIKSDDIAQAVSYADIYNALKLIAEKQTFKLLETLSNKIASILINQFNLSSVKVSVRKPSVPIAGILDYVEVSSELSKNNFA